MFNLWITQRFNVEDYSQAINLVQCLFAHRTLMEPSKVLYSFFLDPPLFKDPCLTLDLPYSQPMLHSTMYVLCLGLEGSNGMAIQPVKYWKPGAWGKEATKVTCLLGIGWSVLSCIPGIDRLPRERDKKRPCHGWGVLIVILTSLHYHISLWLRLIHVSFIKCTP